MVEVNLNTTHEESVQDYEGHMEDIGISDGEVEDESMGLVIAVMVMEVRVVMGGIVPRMMIIVMVMMELIMIGMVLMMVAVTMMIMVMMMI